MCVHDTKLHIVANVCLHCVYCGPLTQAANRQVFGSHCRASPHHPPAASRSDVSVRTPHPAQNNPNRSPSADYIPCVRVTVRGRSRFRGAASHRAQTMCPIGGPRQSTTLFYGPKAQPGRQQLSYPRCWRRWPSTTVGVNTLSLATSFVSGRGVRQTWPSVVQTYPGAVHGSHSFECLVRGPYLIRSRRSLINLQ
jgi:hypothetical protein